MEETTYEDLPEAIRNDRGVESLVGNDRRVVRLREQNIPQHVLDRVRRNNMISSGLFLIGGILFLIPALFTGPLLGLLGFGAAGPVAGSIAAGVQSMIAPVAGGSLFAILQSAGMGGFGAAIINGVAAARGAIGMAVAAVFRFFGGH
ncbi:MAG: hypothetical protein Q9165_007378 [Trypethelium subeluteriae]